MAEQDFFDNLLAGLDESILGPNTLSSSPAKPASPSRRVPLALKSPNAKRIKHIDVGYAPKLPPP